MNDEHQPQAEVAMSEIMAEIGGGKIEVYMNVHIQPCIIFRIPDRPQGSHYLYDEMVRSFIADFIWDRCDILLYERELTRILTVLAGRAMRSRRDQIDDPALLRILQAEPLVAAAYEFIYTHKTGAYEAKAEGLWMELKKFAEEHGLLQLGIRRFPGGHNVLTRALRHFQPVLAALGVEVTIWRSNGCHVILKRRSDDSDGEPSTVPSVPNARSEKGLTSKDDRAERIARLQQKKLASSDQKGTENEPPQAS